MAFAQVAGINFQATALNANGQPMINQQLQVRFTLLDAMATAYEEAHPVVQTDAQGRFSLIIGQGNVNPAFENSIYDVNWEATIDLQVEIHDGNAWLNMGLSPLLDVPYAIRARQANSLTQDDDHRLFWDGMDVLKVEINGTQRLAFDAKTLHVDDGNINVFVGKNAGKNNVLGKQNVFLGENAGLHNHAGASNVVIGQAAGLQMGNSSQNVIIGKDAGYSQADQYKNVMIGYAAGKDNEGNYNTFMGLRTGSKNQENYNVFIGAEAGEQNTSGTTNVFLGTSAGNANQSGGSNVFVGHNSGRGHKEGNKNTFLGTNTGTDNVAGEGNVFVGYNVGRYEKGSDKLYIHNNSSSTPLIYGDFAKKELTVNGELEVKTSATIDDFMRLKPGLAPANPQAGTIYFDQGTHKLRIFDGAAWRTIQAL
jgi:hypothetical protein